MLQLKSLKMLMAISRKKKRSRMETTVVITREEKEVTEVARFIEIEEAPMKKEVIEVITEVTEVITEEEDPAPDTRKPTRMMKDSTLCKIRTPNLEVEEDLEEEETTEEVKIEVEEEENSTEEVKATIEVEAEAEMVKALVEEIEAEVAVEEEKDHQESKPTPMKRVQELVLPLQLPNNSEEN